MFKHFCIEITLSLQDLFEFTDSRLSPKQLKNQNSQYNHFGLEIKPPPIENILFSY